MALWALTDNLAGAPKWLTPTFKFDGTAAFVVGGGTDTITIANHGINDLDQVVLVNGAGGNVATAGVYFASVAGNVIKLYDTKANANTSGAGGREDLTAQGTGHSLQVAPDNLFFIDATEAGLASNRTKGFHVPGWYKYSEGEGGRAGRKDVELVVAVSSANVASGTIGDAGMTGTSATEDAVASDRQISITSVAMPAVDIASNADLVATIVATKSGVAGGTLTFQWQYKVGAGNYANVTVAAGGTAATLTVANTDGDEYAAGVKFRCVVSLAQAESVTSKVVTATQS